MPPSEVAAAFAAAGVEAETGNEVPKTLEKVLATAEREAVICLTGSLFVAAEGRAQLQGIIATV
jgi:folylpolyglutamate synthase/dihydropteroate synthase